MKLGRYVLERYSIDRRDLGVLFSFDHGMLHQIRCEISYLRHEITVKFFDLGNFWIVRIEVFEMY